MKLPLNVTSLKKLTNDPFGFIVDSLIKVIVNLLLPIPLAGDVAVAFRGPVLGCLISVITLGVFLLVVIGMVILSPLFLGESLLQKLESVVTSTSSVSADNTFTQTDTPVQVPLGGHGFEYVSITASFHDPAYFLQFGEDHTGIDLVPNDNYYKNSESYKKYHEVIVYATNTGTARYYTDKNGGLTVVNTNPEGNLRVVEIHMKQVFVKTGDSLKAGTTVGIMGQTGHATGEHVHFEVQVKDGDSWVAVDPMTYIK